MHKAMLQYLVQCPIAKTKNCQHVASSLHDPYVKGETRLGLERGRSSFDLFGLIYNPAYSYSKLQAPKPCPMYDWN